MANAIPGTVGWFDLTVDNAAVVRDFYMSVIGWQKQGVEMTDGDETYNDYCMLPPGADAPVAGICNRRGVNIDLPSAWMIYFTVTDLEASLNEVQSRGGRVLRDPTPAGASGRFAVIEDPAGAVCALYESTGA